VPLRDVKNQKSEPNVERIFCVTFTTTSLEVIIATIATVLDYRMNV